MEKYIIALEAFDRENASIFADYKMSQILPATEGSNATMKQRLHDLWEALRRIAATIWKAIVSAGKWIGEGLGKLINLIRKRPKHVQADAEATDKAAEVAERVLKQERDIDALLSEIDSAHDEFMAGHAERMQQVFEMAAKIEADQKDFEVMYAKVDKELNDLMKDLGIDTAALDSDLSAAMEARGNRPKKDPSAATSKIDQASQSTIKSHNKVQTLIEKLKRSVDKAASEAEHATETEDQEAAMQKRTMLSKLLNAVSRASNWLKSIPSKLSNLFRKLFPPRAKVQKYDGPAPVIDGKDDDEPKGESKE